MCCMTVRWYSGETVRRFGEISTRNRKSAIFGRFRLGNTHCQGHEISALLMALGGFWEIFNNSRYIFAVTGTILLSASVFLKRGIVL